MSNTLDTRLEVFKLEDPLLDLEAKPAYIFERAAQDSNVRLIQSTQFSSDSITFNYLPPSSRTVISRNIRTDITIRFTFTGVDQGGPLLQLGSLDSFLMLNYGVAVGQLQIDNGSNSYNESQVFPLMHRYMSTKNLNESVGYTFNSPDLMYDYDLFLTEGFQYNQSRNFGESAYSDDVLKGRYMRTLVTLPTGGGLNVDPNTEMTVDVRFISPIMLKPCQWQNNLHVTKGLFGVEQFTYIMNLHRDLYKYVWAHAPSGRTVDSVSYNIIGTPYLHVMEYQLQPDQSLPLDLVSYNYSKYYSQVTDFNQTLTPAQTVSVTNSNNQLGGTPEWIAFSVREKTANINEQTPKVALRIKNIKITFDTQILLESADPIQIYEICKKNGYNGTYEDWYNYSGSYVMLKLPSDIQVQALDAPGRLLKHQLQIEVQVENQTSRNIAIEMPLIISYVGVFVKGYNYGQPSQNIVSANDVLNSKNLPAVPRDVLLLEQMYGGFSFKDMYQKAKKIAPKALSLAKKCGPEALDLVKDIAGRGLSAGDGYGSGVVGGRYAKRGKMKKRMKKY